MPRHFILVASFAIISLGLYSQRPYMELTFTAVDSAAYAQIDSIKVMNRTREADTILYWPDTVLSIYYVAIPEISKYEKGFLVYQNHPNPVTDHTSISLFIPERDRVSIMVSDVMGRIILKSEMLLDKGCHSYRFSPGADNLYFFTACWRGQCSSIKILGMKFKSSSTCSIDYTGIGASSPQLKLLADNREFFYIPGDELLFIGYTDGLESGILDAPEVSRKYVFQFATNIPCPGMPIVDYEGQVYHTIQVFSQCWLKENLNVGQMISGATEQSDNEILEKYCYFNEPDSCILYGGFYQWDEMMQYSLQQGVQGICPPGWHLPSDEEWKILEGAADSQYGIGDPEWEGWDYRGHDAGINLKKTLEWYSNCYGNNLYDFSGLLAGSCDYGGYFNVIGNYGRWWTSTGNIYDIACLRTLGCFSHDINRFENFTGNGYSVRCLRNAVYDEAIVLTFSAINNTSPIQIDSIKVVNRTQGAEARLIWPDTTLVIPFELQFDPGDDLLYIGYDDTLESGILDVPEESHCYTFQFARNIPCPGTPTVEYSGQVYNTIQILSQCWLKENMNAGEMIDRSIEQSNNVILEKYCYNDQPDSCVKYGGLYLWEEMMQYNLQPATQGICPSGWHIPTDEEWKVLEGAVDSRYGIGDTIWDMTMEYRGFDAGTNLKATDGWNNKTEGFELSGFSGLPGGLFAYVYGMYFYGGYDGYWWTSTKENDERAWDRYLGYDFPEVYRNSNEFNMGLSVRCLRD